MCTGEDVRKGVYVSSGEEHELAGSRGTASEWLASWLFAAAAEHRHVGYCCSIIVSIHATSDFKLKWVRDSKHEAYLKVQACNRELQRVWLRS